MSVVPPAGNGTTMRIGQVERARAGAGQAEAAGLAASARRSGLRRIVIATSFRSGLVPLS